MAGHAPVLMHSPPQQQDHDSACCQGMPGVVWPGLID